MRIKSVVGVLALLGLTLSSGCASIDAGSNARSFTEETLAGIRVGQATRQDLLQLLGPPERKYNFSALNDEVWDYRYARGSWRMVLDVHLDSRNGKVTSYFSQPDPKIYQPDH